MESLSYKYLILNANLNANTQNYLIEIPIRMFTIKSRDIAGCAE